MRHGSVWRFVAGVLRNTPVEVSRAALRSLEDAISRGNFRKCAPACAISASGIAFLALRNAIRKLRIALRDPGIAIRSFRIVIRNLRIVILDYRNAIRSLRTAILKLRTAILDFRTAIRKLCIAVRKSSIAILSARNTDLQADMGREKPGARASLPAMSAQRECRETLHLDVEG